ncbi:glycosyltransferase [Tessaracoccus palaemonis]|uniref:Glycosyltransferase n=1 Tax=Tessaracoccus palaemonis TaxID=2829499 RepID=A0ABX8SHT0_9ACTN|nr:glycosyltransferase [Tessaracoccus palaemonis]QXT62947.1 glycosyltransferase [Tessaracoccus palaemonis]
MQAKQTRVGEGRFPVDRVIFTQSSVGQLGGIDSVNGVLARQFQARGVQIAYVSGNPPAGRPEIDGDVFVCRPLLSWTADHPLAAQYPGRMGIRLLIKRLLTPVIRIVHRARVGLFLQRLGPGDVVLLSSPGVVDALRLGPQAATKAYLVAHGHTSFEGYRLYGWLESQRRQMQFLDHLVVLTREDARRLSEALDVEVGCVANPSDVVPVPGVVREKTVVSVSRLSSEKRIDTAIRAFDLAADEVPGWRFQIYGDGVERDALEELARGCRNADRIEFCGRTDDAAAVFSGAELAILTSEFEGQPMSVIEAARCGTPTVSVGSVPEVARIAKRCGYLVDSERPEDVAATLVRAMRDEAGRHERGRLAIEFGKEHDPSSIVDQWMELFETRDPSSVTLAHPDGTLTAPAGA